ncbi:DUF2493 domain-containing protein [Candidatus Pacearchaeota archaeon]|nr:DUF2493 domain-containing protein [Candidatus Pacearchaeota archaeon]
MEEVHIRVIIAGGRTICDKRLLWDVIQGLDFEITEVVSGMAKGADAMGVAYATWAEIPVAEFPAEWDNFNLPGTVVKKGQYGEYNATAGFFRNDEMAQYADVLILVWDGSSRGSSNMKELAEFYGLRIIEKIVRSGNGGVSSKRNVRADRGRKP